MSSSFEVIRPLPEARFGGTVRLTDGVDNARAFIAAAEREAEALPRALAQCEGLCC